MAKEILNAIESAGMSPPDITYDSIGEMYGIPYKSCRVTRKQWDEDAEKWNSGDYN